MFQNNLNTLRSFFGLFGIYYALQYLSLADATVLTFLAPILTTFTGAMFLGERFSWKQVAAGRKYQRMSHAPALADGP